MRIIQIIKPVLALSVLAGVGIAGYTQRQHWMPLLFPEQKASTEETSDETPVAITKIIINDQAQANLGLVAKPVQVQSYWKTIQIPGAVVDRPGYSDRGVVTPATGVVVKLFHTVGETVRAGEPLFRVKLLSETLHTTQTELFKITQDISTSQAQRKRWKESEGAVPQSQIIDIENQIARYEVLAKAYRRELQNRGFTLPMIDEVAKGIFVTEIDIAVPSRSSETPIKKISENPSELEEENTFEIQELKIELGQQVQAGQTVFILANHKLLTIEGRAFSDEVASLEKSVLEKWPVNVDFQQETSLWGEWKHPFYVRHISNTIDPVSRTFSCWLPLENESRVVQEGNRTQTLWRFRPGQRVRMSIRTEEMKNVLVVPLDAITREGGDVFVFIQNVNTFERVPVRLLLQDRQSAILANDGSLIPGSYVVQSGATQINRMMRANASNGVPKGYHVHADGSLHKNEDEGK